MTLQLTMKLAKDSFFDRQIVMDKTARARKRNLSKIGAFVRTKARQSIKKPGKRVTKSARAIGESPVSRPGQPPFSHTGLLRDFIFFSYDAGSESVVIGPVKLNQKIGDAPAALEHGGKSSVATGRRGKRKVRNIVVRKRPYMRPARDDVMTNELADIWKDSIR